MTLFGVTPRPRALLMHVGKEDAAALDEVFATTRTIESLDEVVQGEWDVLLVDGKMVPVDTELHLFVLARGVHLAGRCVVGRGNVYQLESREKTPAREFVVPDDLPPQVGKLAALDLLPHLEDSSSNPHYNLRLVTSAGSPRPSTDEVIRPFVATRVGGAMLAGKAPRGHGPAEVWFLPPAANITAWGHVAVQCWRELAPEVFPVSDWKAQPVWQVAEERQLGEELARYEAEREDYLKRAHEREENLRQRLAAARDTADAGPRALLRAAGRDLVGEVAETLRLLGFDVEERDELVSESGAAESGDVQGQLLEDLRIRTRDDSGWVALVEVRAYKGGAKTNDLLRIGRFVERFIQEERRAPSGRWYIVSQFRERDPGERPQVFEAQPEDLDAFAESGGMAIDTSELFKLRVAVESEVLGADGVRDYLMQATGRVSAEDLLGSG